MELSAELKQLYQDLILDHGRRPRHFKKLDHYTHHLDGYNPVCGDQITLYLEVEGDTVKDASFLGHGCAISMASASLMASQIRGKRIDDVKALQQCFHQVVTTDDDREAEKLGKLKVLAGVKAFPSRVKCATLAWHTLKNALEGQQGKVSTE